MLLCYFLLRSYPESTYAAYFFNSKSSMYALWQKNMLSLKKQTPLLDRPLPFPLPLIGIYRLLMDNNLKMSIVCSALYKLQRTYEKSSLRFKSAALIAPSSVPSTTLSNASFCSHLQLLQFVIFCDQSQVHSYLNLKCRWAFRWTIRSILNCTDMSILKFTIK